MNRGARNALLVSILLTVVLEHVPYARALGRPLVWLSTLAHELGHGITALLVGAHFNSFTLYADASGAAGWSGRPGALGRGMIAAGGLVGPAVAAALCFLLARSARGARWALGMTSALLLVALVTVVNNAFAFGFVACVAAVLGAVAWRLGPEAARVTVTFLGVQLALSVFSRSDYLFTTVARTGAGVMPSDTAHMAEALWLPAWFWGLVCGAISVLVLAGGVVGALWTPEGGGSSDAGSVPPLPSA